MYVYDMYDSTSFQVSTLFSHENDKIENWKI